MTDRLPGPVHLGALAGLFLGVAALLLLVDAPRVLSPSSRPWIGLFTLGMFVVMPVGRRFEAEGRPLADVPPEEVAEALRYMFEPVSL